MRLRDLKWYFLACIILLISYAAIAVCYYFSIHAGKVQNSMKELGLEVTQNVNDLINQKISSYYDIYVKDEDGTLVKQYEEQSSETKIFETLPDSSTVWNRRNEFNDLTTKVIYAQASSFEKAYVNGALVGDREFYFYFGKQVGASGFQITRIKASEFLSFIEYDYFIFDMDTVNYSTTGRTTNTVTVSNIDKVATEEDVTNLIGNSYKSEIDSTTGYFNSVLSFNKGKDAAVSIVSNDFVGSFAVAIDTENTYLGIAWVYQQAIIYYVAGVAIMAIMILILVLGCRKTSQLLRADRHALQKSEAIVLRITPAGKVIFTNKTFKKIYGISREVDVNHFIDVLTNEPILKTIKQNKAFTCSVPMDDLGINLKYFQLSPLYISGSYYLMGTDVTLDYNEAQDLRNLSGHNEVTGCENGFILTTRFEKIRSDIYVGQDICFLECNIHKYNDLITIFGKTAYNIVLNEFLKLLRESFEDMEIYHMDESKFIVIYPNNNMTEVNERVAAFMDKLKRPITVRANNIYLDIKIVAYNLKNGLTYEELVGESTSVLDDEYKKNTITFKDIETKLDLAYRNISGITSKDYIVYEPAMDGIILASDEMDRDIETGLIDQEFQMWLQPQFDVVNNRIDGFEALIRWMNPKYRDKSPQAFIELAEQRGHMLDIGRFVIKESFRLAKRVEPYGVHVSINVSPVQLLQVGFVQQLIEEFNRNQLKPGSIAVEITETLLMGSFKLVAEKLKLLREAGFHIHLDDFCTGYSSMLYLKDLPVDTLKIDKEFTKYIVTNKYNENIVKTICNLGNSLDLDLICEGVETQEQSDMVKKMGCRVIQGWLIGKAMPYDQAVDLLEKYNTKK